MTKEQVLKHKEVIKWFCDNTYGSVVRKDYNTGIWNICSQPEFSIQDTYIENDMYVEFRKALVNGKIVQLNNRHKRYDTKLPNGWVNIDKIYNNIDIKEYRIKPMEEEIDTPEGKDWFYEQLFIRRKDSLRNDINVCTHIGNIANLMFKTKLNEEQ